jgi:hypothetical protein
VDGVLKRGGVAVKGEYLYINGISNLSVRIRDGRGVVVVDFVPQKPRMFFFA